MNIRITLLVLILATFAVVSSPTQSGRNQPEPGKGRQAPTKPARPDLSLPRKPSEKSPANSEAIRIDTDLVTLVASVDAPTGASASGLEIGDFEVIEDGIPQEISNFARHDQAPLSFVMLFDTSLSVAPRIGFQRRAAARFFGRVMRGQDRGALFAVSTGVTLLQPFTNRVSILVDATKQLQAHGATSLYDGIYEAADYLSRSPGRRVIIVVSDGGDTTSTNDLKQALKKAQQSDVVLYAVFTGNSYLSENLRDLAAERALQALTGETGGEVYQPKVQDEDTAEQALRELDTAFSRLAEQLRTQYTLGFYSSNEGRDGQFHRLTVKIKKAGYTVRARAGYFSTKG